MTRVQRIVLSVVSGALLLMLFYPPYTRYLHSVKRVQKGYGFLFDVIQKGGVIDVQTFAVQCAIVLLVGGMMAFAFKK